MALKASSILGDPTGLMVIDRSRADCCHTLGAVGTTAATFFSEAVQFVFQGWRAGSPRHDIHLIADRISREFISCKEILQFFSQKGAP